MRCGTQFVYSRYQFYYMVQRVTYLEKRHIKPILNELKVDSRRGTILYCIQHNSIMCVESEPMIKRANDTEKANRNEGLKITVERKRTKCDRYVPYKIGRASCRERV